MRFHHFLIHFPNLFVFLFFKGGDKKKEKKNYHRHPNSHLLSSWAQKCPFPFICHKVASIGYVRLPNKIAEACMCPIPKSHPTPASLFGIRDGTFLAQNLTIFNCFGLKNEDHKFFTKGLLELGHLLVKKTKLFHIQYGVIPKTLQRAQLSSVLAYLNSVSIGEKWDNDLFGGDTVN